jgi:hypothetical protein
MILPTQINLAELAFLAHQAEEEMELQARIIKARELYAGYFDEDLAEKTADFLIGNDASDIEGINLMAIALDTLVRRVNLESVKSVPPEETGGENTANIEMDAFFERIFKYNKIYTLQKDLHRWTQRDGEAFLIIDYQAEKIWDEDPSIKGLPKFYIHERYTDPGVTWKGFQGSGEGCKAHYRNNDHNQELDMVSKRWTEQLWGKVPKLPRVNIYRPGLKNTLSANPETGNNFKTKMMNHGPFGGP